MPTITLSTIKKRWTAAFILTVFLSATISCREIYKSYQITDNGKFQKTEKQINKKKGYERIEEFTYYLPKQTCANLDSNQLKIYAQLILDRHFKGATIESFKITSESEGHFTYKGFHVIHSTLDILFNKTTCTIIYHRYNANVKGF